MTPMSDPTIPEPQPEPTEPEPEPDEDAPEHLTARNRDAGEADQLRYATR
jgi:hypothetical protein